MTSESSCGTPLTSPYWPALAVTLTISGHLVGLRVHSRRRCFDILIQIAIKDRQTGWQVSEFMRSHRTLVRILRKARTIIPKRRPNNLPPQQCHTERSPKGAVEGSAVLPPRHPLHPSPNIFTGFPPHSDPSKPDSPVRSAISSSPTSIPSTASPAQSHPPHTLSGVFISKRQPAKSLEHDLPCQLKDSSIRAVLNPRDETKVRPAKGCVRISRIGMVEEVESLST